MNADKFNAVLAEQIQRVNDILGSKAGEYADDSDRLHNFRLTATLQGTTPQKALAGMMAKHTASIFDMIRSDQTFPLEKWDEKITDHINYLIILRAIVVEEDEEDAKLGVGSTD